MTTPGEGFPELTFAASVPPPATVTETDVRATTGTTVVPSAMEGEEGGSRVISWHNLLWETPKIAAAGDIETAEAKLNVSFPADYKAVVTEHQGQEASPSIFKFYNPELEAYDATQLSTLLHFVADDTEHAQQHIVAIHEELKDSLPEGVVPFGEDTGGSYIAFDYRVVGKVEGATGPYVVYLDRDEEGDDEEDDEGKMKTIFVADSFTSFLGLLRSEEEMEAEMEAAELVGDAAGEEQEEDSEEGEEEEREGGEDDDADEASHVTKKRRNEEGNEDVSAEAGHEADDDDASSVGDKRKSSDQ